MQLPQNTRKRFVKSVKLLSFTAASFQAAIGGAFKTLQAAHSCISCTKFWLICLILSSKNRMEVAVVDGFSHVGIYAHLLKMGVVFFRESRSTLDIVQWVIRNRQCSLPARNWHFLREVCPPALLVSNQNGPALDVCAFLIVFAFQYWIARISTALSDLQAHLSISCAVSAPLHVLQTLCAQLHRTWCWRSGWHLFAIDVIDCNGMYNGNDSGWDLHSPKVICQDSASDLI